MHFEWEKFACYFSLLHSQLCIMICNNGHKKAAPDLISKTFIDIDAKALVVLSIKAVKKDYCAHSTTIFSAWFAIAEGCFCGWIEKKGHDFVAFYISADKHRQMGVVAQTH